MNVKWFQNPDHIVYVNAEEFLPRFAKEIGIPDLKDQVEAFRANPAADGITLKGQRRASIRLFVPNLMFDEPIEMGENVWIYLGENYECYSLYWPW